MQITGSKKQSEERAALIAVRANLACYVFYLQFSLGASLRALCVFEFDSNL